jgi:Flp pilus assembly protein TadD
MSGVKPKVFCARCNAELEWKAASCPSCGVEIDWTGSSLRSPENHEPRSGKRRREISRTWPSKAYVGVIIAAAIAVIVYEGVNGKRQDSGVGGTLSAGEVRVNDAQAAMEIRALEKSVAERPDEPALTLQLANSLQDHSMFEKAIHYYSIYLAKNPKNADARVDMGICYKGINDLNEAEKQMREALTYAPRHLNATFNLGIVCLDEGKIQESNEWLRRAAALDPNGEVGKRAMQLVTQHNSHIPITQ